MTRTRENFREGELKWGFPPDNFEQDIDLYNNTNFQRRYYRERARRKRGYTAVDDLFEDDNTIHMQCPYEGCKTWFQVPREFGNARSSSFTGEVTCPCCHATSKVGKAGELEEM